MTTVRTIKITDAELLAEKSSTLYGGLSMPSPWFLRRLAAQKLGDRLEVTHINSSQYDARDRCHVLECYCRLDYAVKKGRRIKPWP